MIIFKVWWHATTLFYLFFHLSSKHTVFIFNTTRRVPSCCPHGFRSVEGLLWIPRPVLQQADELLYEPRRTLLLHPDYYIVFSAFQLRTSIVIVVSILVYQKDDLFYLPGKNYLSQGTRTRDGLDLFTCMRRSRPRKKGRNRFKIIIYFK
jgi:hypothetical protein